MSKTCTTKRKPKITRRIYEFCYTLRLLEECKMYGLVEGGYKVHLEKIDEIIAAGEKRGFLKPSDKRIGEIIAAMNADIAAKRKD